MRSAEVSETLKELISEHFAGFDAIGTNADIVIRKMTPEMRQEYFEEAERIVRSKVWETEINNLIRDYFNHLAFKASTEKVWSEQDAYRLAVISIQNLDMRLKRLVTRKYSPMAKVSRSLTSLDKKKIANI